MLYSRFCFAGNVHVTWRNPDPLYSWESNQKTFKDLKNRDSYIGEHLLIYTQHCNPCILLTFFFFVKRSLIWAVMKLILQNENWFAKCVFSTGYSTLEAQKLLSHSDYTLLTGAPRDKSVGSVLFATKIEIQNSLNPVQIITGEQVGSYFGNCLAVTDLNNDECVPTQINWFYEVYFYLSIFKSNAECTF